MRLNSLIPTYIQLKGCVPKQFEPAIGHSINYVRDKHVISKLPVWCQTAYKNTDILIQVSKIVIIAAIVFSIIPLHLPITVPVIIIGCDIYTIAHNIKEYDTSHKNKSSAEKNLSTATLYVADKTKQIVQSKRVKKLTERITKQTKLGRFTAKKTKTVLDNNPKTKSKLEKTISEISESWPKGTPAQKVTNDILEHTVIIKRVYHCYKKIFPTK